MTDLSPKDKFKGQIGFAIGTGRCGTQFIAKVIEREANVSSVHERNPFNETFHRYCKWYGLLVDSEGFLQTKTDEIQQDLESHDFSFEASAHLSLSVPELYDRFGAKFLLMVRSPEKVVNSYLKKGWYEKPVLRANPNLPPSYQHPSKEFHHFLGRIVPSKDKFAQWNQMSRVGKLAWYWNALNAKVLEQFASIPETHWRIEKLEDLSYDRYREVTDFLGFKSAIAPETYDNLAQSRPNAKSRLRALDSWTQTEIDEFEAEVKPMAERFGYEYRVSQLLLMQQQLDLATVPLEGEKLTDSEPKQKKTTVASLMQMGRGLAMKFRSNKQ